MNDNVRGLAFAVTGATAAAVVLDAAGVQGAFYAEAPSLVVVVPALSLLHALTLFAGTFGLVLCTAVHVLGSGATGMPGAVVRVLPWVGAALAVGSALAHLIVYEAFAEYVSVWIGYAGLFVAVGVACSGRLARATSSNTRFQRVLARATPLGALWGAIGAYAGCFLLHVDDYPTLRLSLAQLGHLLLVIAFFHGARWLNPASLRRLASPWPPLAVLALAVVALASGLLEDGRPLFLASTALGGAQASLHPYAVQDETPKGPVPDDPGGVARFLHHAKMPTLPPDFDLRRHNVLFLMSEATRFDQTSLAATGLATTPNLQALHRSGAFLWTRAFSPSSGTLLSLSSIFGLSYPSRTFCRGCCYTVRAR